jgi:aminoglycoside 6'-N-acetyltransferase I
MDPVVRLLWADDLPLLTGAGPEVFDAPVLADRAAAFLADRRHHLVGAIVDGALAGFVSAAECLHPDKPPELFIMEVGVAEPLQRRGIGRAMLEAMLAHGRRRGCALAWVATEVGNAPAQALYRSAAGTPDDDPATVFTFPLRPPAPADAAASR